MIDWVNAHIELPNPTFAWVLVHHDGAICTAAYSRDKGFFLPYPYNGECNVNLAEVTEWAEVQPPEAEK